MSEIDSDDVRWMRVALQQAQCAADLGEVPVGAVLVRDGEMLAQAHNHPIGNVDPTAHAEVQVLRVGATYVNNYRLVNTTLYVTIEPCAMCLGALMHARVQRLVFGALEPRAGCVHSHSELLDKGVFNHKLVVEGGVLAEECAALMRDFFKQRR